MRVLFVPAWDTRLAQGTPLLCYARSSSHDLRDLRPISMSDLDPLTDTLTRLLVDKVDGPVELTPTQQEQLNVELQATLGADIERIKAEQRLAFENARKVTLN